MKEQHVDKSRHPLNMQNAPFGATPKMHSISPVIPTLFSLHTMSFSLVPSYFFLKPDPFLLSSSFSNLQLENLNTSKFGETSLSPKTSETSMPPPSTPTTPKSEVLFERFTSAETENAYRVIFSHHLVLGEREVKVDDFRTLIMLSWHLEKITQKSPSLLVEIVRELYSNLSLQNLEDYYMTCGYRGIY